MKITLKNIHKLNESELKLDRYYTIEELEEFLGRKPKIQDIIDQWVKHSRKLQDRTPQAYFSVAELDKYKEYDRSIVSRNTPEENEEIKQSIVQNGYNMKSHFWVSVYKDTARAKLGEGNHRLMILKQLGKYDFMVPVMFTFTWEK